MFYSSFFFQEINQDDETEIHESLHDTIISGN